MSLFIYAFSNKSVVVHIVLVYWIYWAYIIRTFNLKEICGILLSEAKNVNQLEKYVRMTITKKKQKFMRNGQHVIVRLASIKSIDAYNLKPSVYTPIKHSVTWFPSP